jgi:hypothetical protein
LAVGSENQSAIEEALDALEDQGVGTARARAEVSALRAENARMREALEKIARTVYPEEIIKDTLPAGYGVSAEEVGAAGPWYGLRLASGEERGWSRSYYKMDLGDVGAPEPYARELADIARAALAAKEKV